MFGCWCWACYQCLCHQYKWPTAIWPPPPPPAVNPTKYEPLNHCATTTAATAAEIMPVCMFYSQWVLKLNHYHIVPICFCDCHLCHHFALLVCIHYHHHRHPATIAPDSITKRTKTPIGHVLGLVNAYVLVVEAETNIPDVIINSTIDPAVNDAGS